jgi:hypothetical protein
LNVGPVPNVALPELGERRWKIFMAVAPVVDHLGSGEPEALGDLRRSNQI